ncbi:MAG: hypothetical protein GY853_16505 [PVC group bacterium]|nr:hypothetical protein [PVC group bacterium]
MKTIEFNRKWNVIPINKNTKKPSIKWREYMEKHFPPEQLPDDSNYAVICGETSNKLVVIDLDYSGRNCYLETIYPLFNQELNQLSNTYTEHSPAGSHIFYYIKHGITPKRKINDNSKKEDILKSLKRTIKTNFDDILKGVDILGEGGYCIIAPSKINGKSYTKGLEFNIKTITVQQFEEVKNFFIKEKTTTTKLRRPFEQILKGELEIENMAIEHGTEEHVYWKFLFREVYHRLGLEPQDIFSLLEKSQPAFDVDKTEQQLEHHDHTDLPLTNAKMKKYFPNHKIEAKSTIGNKKIPTYILIADFLMDKYDIITMSDSEEIMIRHGNIYSSDLSEFNRDIVLEVERYGLNISRIETNILKRIKALTSFDRDNLCYDDWMVNFKNGYYDIKEDKFVSNEDNTDKLFCYEIPHEYNPEFIGSCPKYKRVLRQWLGGSNKILLPDIFEMIGYTMTMNTDMKMAFYIFGPPHTGKTQFQSILEALIGHENRADVSLQRMSKNEFGSHGLQFKILNMVGDMSSLNPKDVSMFKTLTGGDRWVRAEIKGGKHYQFLNIIKIWYNGNSLPQLNDEDNAFYERWILINFPNRFPMYNDKTIKNIAKTIYTDPDEIQGLIHESIKGLKRLIKRKYFRKGIIKNTKYFWEYNSNPLYAFMADHCKKTKGGEILKKDFIEKLNGYLYRKGHKSFSMIELSKKLESHGIYWERRSHDGERDFYYLGIEWADQKSAYDSWTKNMGYNGNTKMDDYE